jgi:hypothetical protein
VREDAFGAVAQVFEHLPHPALGVEAHDDKIARRPMPSLGVSGSLLQKYAVGPAMMLSYVPVNGIREQPHFVQIAAAHAPLDVVVAQQGR